MNDFVALRSNSRMVALIGVSLGCLAVGLWMTGLFNDVPLTGRYPYAVTVGVGWSCVVLFGIFAFAGVKGLLGPSELLRIGPEGVRWAPLADQIIPWTAVRDVTTREMRGQEFLVLRLHDGGNSPAQTVLDTRPLYRAISGGDISISLGATDRSIDEAFTAVVRFRGNDR